MTVRTVLVHSVAKAHEVDKLAAFRYLTVPLSRCVEVSSVEPYLLLRYDPSAVFELM